MFTFLDRVKDVLKLFYILSINSIQFYQNAGIYFAIKEAITEPASTTPLRSDMNLRKFSQQMAAALSLAAALTGQLQADTLFPGNAATLSYVSTPSGVEVASAYNDISAGPITGKVGVKILSGVIDNPFAGGLTFVYEIQNTSLPSQGPYAPGITFFDVSGWAGLDVIVAQSNDSYLFSPTGLPVVPGPAFRSNDGDIVTFTFPPDNPGGGGEPPIFAGEYGYQLIIYSNVTAWQSVIGNIITEDFLSPSESVGNLQYMTVSTLSAVAAVPDHATTALLLVIGAGVLVMFASAQRKQVAIVAARK